MGTSVPHLFDGAGNGERMTVSTVYFTMSCPPEVNTDVFVLYRLERFPEIIYLEETFHDMNHMFAAIHIPRSIWVILHTNVKRFLRWKG